MKKEKLEFDLDFILYSLDLAIERIIEDNIYLSLPEDLLYLKEMRGFLSTRIIKLRMYNTPESETTYNFDLDTTIVEKETFEELKDQIGGYLTSNLLRNIITIVTPHKVKIIEIIRIKMQMKLDIAERDEGTKRISKINEEIKKLTKKITVIKQKKDLIRQTGKNTKISIHIVKQFYGDNKPLSPFTDEKIDLFTNATGLNLTNRPTNYGVVLNQAQRKVFEGILKAFTDTNYKGDEQKDKKTALEEVYSNTKTSGEILSTGDKAPYKNIENVPVVRLTQAQVIDLSGYDLRAQKQSDKQHVIEALSFLATNQFCFYWIRLKTEKGKPVKDKRGDYVFEEVMEVGTLLRIKTVRDQTGLLQYYEIHPSAPVLDQVSDYFLLVPNNWREEVKLLTGKRASSYTYELLLWLRLQFEQIRRHNSGGGKNRRPKPFKLSKRWEDVAIALKMPETVYKANRKKAYKIIQEAYSIAIKLGYLVKVEDNGATDVLYLNESYYPKPGELV
jgi:hypothetical protein